MAAGLHNVQFWEASVPAGLRPTPGQNGGDARGCEELGWSRCVRPMCRSARFQSPTRPTTSSSWQTCSGDPGPVQWLPGLNSRESGVDAGACPYRDVSPW